MLAKVPGKFEESGILFAHAMKYSDGGSVFAGHADDTSPRAAELPLQRLHLHYRRMKVLLKKIFENVHV